MDWVAGRSVSRPFQSILLDDFRRSKEGYVLGLGG